MAQTVIPKRAQTAIIAGMLCLSFAWSWSWEINDVGPGSHRIVLTLLGIGSSFASMWAGLAAAKVPRGGRIAASFWAILPWNSVLLSQVPYIGYVFIPVEVLASAWLLRWRTPLSRLTAFLLATVTRAAVFAFIAAAACVLRTWNRP
jgi:hypothetical protein